MNEPLEKLALWLKEAEASPEVSEPTAMMIATADEHGFPSVRTVLLKHWDELGLVFYTNANSQKGQELAINPQAEILFYWMPLKRQIRVRGNVTPTTTEESDAYFASRRRGSQIGAHASQQSEPLESYDSLLNYTKELEAKFAGEEVPRPEHWHGWRVSLNRIEFWQEGEYRLHERECYEHHGSGWTQTLLNP
jgi:pyridoxamine 5'-phosphate oxidase